MAVGTDNVRDAFNPFGNGDLIENAIFASLACHLVGTEDFQMMVRLHTFAAADVMKLQDYGLAPGCYADAVVFAARSWEAMLDGETSRAFVLKRGKIAATTELTRRLLLKASVSDPSASRD